MTPAHAVVIAAAGLGAGTINTIVGSGSLITFPTLIALGVPPVQANVSNTIGLFPGSISGALGYRRELAGQRRRVTSFSLLGGVGGLVGGVLLLLLPGSVFKAVVPVLIISACVLVVVQPRLARAMADRHGDGPAEHGGPWLFAGMFLSSIYGGYFGAAQGVLYIALLGIFLRDEIQRLNALKNVVAAVVNGMAALLFVAASPLEPATSRPDWAVAGLIAVGSVIGGQLGAHIGRRLPPVLLRVVIVGVGAIAVWRLLG